MSCHTLPFLRRSGIPAALAATLLFLLAGVAQAAETPSATRSYPSWMLHLPAVNAGFNGLSTALLIAGFVFIRRGNKSAHRACMLSALGSSALFLAGYLSYHFVVHQVTRFTDPEWFRPIYLGILLTHTVLAVVIVPLVFITFRFALQGRFEAHRRVARWTWPIWLYVSFTGVLIYWILYIRFPQS